MASGGNPPRNSSRPPSSPSRAASSSPPSSPPRAAASSPRALGSNSTSRLPSRNSAETSTRSPSHLSSYATASPSNSSSPAVPRDRRASWGPLGSRVARADASAALVRASAASRTKEGHSLGGTPRSSAERIAAAATAAFVRALSSLVLFLSPGASYASARHRHEKVPRCRPRRYAASSAAASFATALKTAPSRRRVRETSATIEPVTSALGSSRRARNSARAPDAAADASAGCDVTASASAAVGENRRKTPSAGAANAAAAHAAPAISAAPSFLVHVPTACAAATCLARLASWRFRLSLAKRRWRSLAAAIASRRASRSPSVLAVAGAAVRGREGARASTARARTASHRNAVPAAAAGARTIPASAPSARAPRAARSAASTAAAKGAVADRAAAISGRNRIDAHTTEAARATPATATSAQAARARRGTAPWPRLGGQRKRFFSGTAPCEVHHATRSFSSITKASISSPWLYPVGRSMRVGASSGSSETPLEDASEVAEARTKRGPEEGTGVAPRRRRVPREGEATPEKPRARRTDARTNAPRGRGRRRGPNPGRRPKRHRAELDVAWKGAANRIRGTDAMTPEAVPREGERDNVRTGKNSAVG